MELSKRIRDLYGEDVFSEYISNEALDQYAKDAGIDDSQTVINNAWSGARRENTIVINGWAGHDHNPKKPTKILYKCSASDEYSNDLQRKFLKDDISPDDEVFVINDSRWVDSHEIGRRNYYVSNLILSKNEKLIEYFGSFRIQDFAGKTFLRYLISIRDGVVKFEMYDEASCDYIRSVVMKNIEEVRSHDAHLAYILQNQYATHVDEWFRAYSDIMKPNKVCEMKYSANSLTEILSFVAALNSSGGIRYVQDKLNEKPLDPRLIP